MSQNETKLNAITKLFKYQSLILRHTLSPQTLARTPEPFTLTEQTPHVEEYSRAFDSVMMLPYVLALDLIHRVMPGSEKANLQAADLCCGPGHFTRLLVKEMNFKTVTGVDLSEPMLKIAGENAEREKLAEHLRYLKSDVANLSAINTESLDLVSFMDGAHHMPSIEKVSQILAEADRVAKSEGLIFILDPVRPRTLSTANLYHQIAGKAYLDKGLKHFNQDFWDSIMASWSFQELFEAIPRTTKRSWIQLRPFGFPAFQVMIGLPEGRREVYIHEGLSDSRIERLIPQEGRMDWKMLRLSFRMAKIQKYLPQV